jgi:hypothetical protein
LGVNLDEDENTRPLEGLESRWVVIELPDREKLTLTAYEGKFPDWRTPLSRFEADTVPGFALSAWVTAVLADLMKVNPDLNVVVSHGGQNRLSKIMLARSEQYVEGGIMPVRWNFETDAPHETPDAQREEAVAPDGNLLRQAMELVVRSGMATPSTLHRKLKVTFAEADALLRTLQERGVVGLPEHDLSRPVLMGEDELANFQALFEMEPGGDDAEA